MIEEGPFSPLSRALAKQAQLGLTRQRRATRSPPGPQLDIKGQRYLAFCNNDYLGLANHASIRSALTQAVEEIGVGAGASALISGYHQLHAALETELERWLGRPALLFPSGYEANIGVIPALVGRRDAVFADKLNHASLNDGCLLSRAHFHRYAHQRLDQLAQQLARSVARRRLIVVDGVFSMDGDIAPLASLAALAERYQAWLYVDDAHGFGILGAEGRGTVALAGLSGFPRLIHCVTFGKAAGVSGAAVLAPAVVIDWLTQQARSYVYTTASPPALAAALLAAIELIRKADAERARLAVSIQQFRAGCLRLRWPLSDSSTPIQPLMIGSATDTVKIAERLWQRGIWVPAIRPPTVMAGRSRLRISLSAQHQTEDISRLIDELQRLSLSFE